MFHRYKDASDGLAGNDDGGTLSAWYIFSSLGMYPLAGTERYVFGKPIFDRIEFQNEAAPQWIQRQKDDIDYQIMINDQNWPKPDIRHFALQNAQIMFQ